MMNNDDEQAKMYKNARQLCDHALSLNNECWPALWFKASALGKLKELAHCMCWSYGDAREGLESMRVLGRFRLVCVGMCAGCVNVYVWTHAQTCVQVCVQTCADMYVYSRVYRQVYWHL